MFEDAHDPVVMPFSVDERRLPLRTFMAETAGAIASDGPLNTGKNAKVVPV